MADLSNLTVKQQAILKFIREHIQEKGFPPAIRDICDAFGISSPNGVMCHLKALQKKGHINRVEKRDNRQRAQARGITIPGVNAGGVSLPLRGVGAAGPGGQGEGHDGRVGGPRPRAARGTAAPSRPRAWGGRVRGPFGRGGATAVWRR